MFRWLGLIACLLFVMGATSVADENSDSSGFYYIGSLDVLSFRIVGEPETETQVRVSQDGFVSLPYAGKYQIAGKTLQEAREELYEIYKKDYYVDPQIDLAVVAYKERRVMVQGMVNQQGFIIIPPEESLTLLGAISQAGGWSNNRLANKRSISLKRVVDGKVVEYIVDATELGPLDWPVKDGDVITVPERLF